MPRRAQRATCNLCRDRVNGVVGQILWEDKAGDTRNKMIKGNMEMGRQKESTHK